MRIPSSGSHWENRASDKLTSCFFEMFITKMDEIQEEFDGSARKQTKQDTIAEGFKNTFNAQAATNLVGKKFIISRNGQPLHLTTLPTDVLRQIPLPQEYEDELGGGSNVPASSGAFAGFAGMAKAGASSSDTEGRRLGMAAKRLFMGLGAAFEVVYADSDSGLVIVEVVDVAKKPEAFISMIEGVFDSGEPPETGGDRYKISFGLLKDIK